MALAVLAFQGALVGLSGNVDRLAREREEAQARNALQERIVEVADSVVPTADWDEAVANAVDHFDPRWVRANFNFGFAQNNRLAFVALFDPADRPVYFLRDQTGLPEPPPANLPGQAAPLLASVRAQEVRRGSFAGRINGAIISKPIQATSLVVFEGQIEILTATLIQPDFGAVLPTGPRSAIMVTARAIDASFLRNFSQRLLLQDVRLAPPGKPRPDAHVELTDDRGRVLGVLTWKPHRPGWDLMLMALLPITIGVAAPLVLFSFGQHTARRLISTLDALAKARDEADAANAQKSVFLATMSHEIRTPLNGILAMSEVMARGELPADQRRNLAVISHSSEALLTIVNDILDLSKIEAGRMEFDPRPFDLGEMIAALKGLYGPVAREKGLTFRVRIAPEAEGWWMGDLDRIRQVIANLASNALKFTDQGEVRLELLLTAEGALRIEVADTGVGMTPDQQELVFEKFRQADASISRRFGGTGLGLPICRQLAELMGGRIWLTSREGVGSTFFVELPLERAAGPQAPAPDKALGVAELGSEIRVLAADDNAVNRQVLAAILEPFGFDLVLCEDGAAALKAWRASVFDLILMDVQMPVMDGVTATERIREEEAAGGRRRTPVIALTANAMTHQLAEYSAAGMDDCVSKPIRINDLQAAILRQLEGAPLPEVTLQAG